jgi:hypothetical protein
VIARAMIATLLAGCIADLGPEVGPPRRALCDNADSEPGTATSYERDIVPILDGNRCFDCHTPGGKTPFGLEVSGLDLSTRSTLLAGGGRSAATIVLPGRPCESILLQKIQDTPPFGGRMPLDGPPFVDPFEIQTIGDWIAEGGL